MLCLLLTSSHAFAQFIDDQTAKEINSLTNEANTFLADTNFLKAGQAYGKIAVIYWKAGVINEAANNYNIAANCFLKINRLDDVKTIYTNIAVAYSDIEEINLMCQYFEKSLEIRRRIDNKEQIAAGLVDVAFAKNKLSFFDDAIENLNEALALATDAKNTSLVIECYRQLAINYRAIGNIKLAQEMAQRAESYAAYASREAVEQEFEKRTIKSEIKIAESEQNLLEQQLRYNIAQMEAKSKQDSMNYAIRQKQDSILEIGRIAHANKLENEKLEKERELTRVLLEQQRDKERTQRHFIYIAIGVLGIMTVFGIFLIRAYRIRNQNNIKLAKQNIEIKKKGDELNEALKKIAHQNQNITQSINYAKGIQQAMLQNQDTLNDYLKDAFIFFKPRDIVSGDFYWFKEVTIPDGSKRFIVSAIDCTGHGVPGAFMSLIGFNLLNEITNSGIYKANEILEALHIGVQETLKQKENANQDGMDMALCVIDIENKTVEFAGAKNPVVYIQNNEINVIKGSQNGIGGKDENVKFQLNTITVDQPTWFYIFSDGYIDQFGGELGRKFMISNFKKYLLKIHSLSNKEQRELLKQNLLEWRGTKYNQLDDVLVIGFKLG